MDLRRKFACITILLFYLWRACGITLFDNARSYAIFNSWNITSVGKLELKFRTQSQYCLLLYIDDDHFSQPAGIAPSKDPHSRSYFEITLKRGELVVTQQIADSASRSTVRLGQHLNDLQWHQLRITKYVGTLQVVIDSKTNIVTFPKSIAHRFRINSRLFIGGLSRNKMEHSYGNAKSTPRFVGCIEDLQYSSGTMMITPVHRFLKGESLAPTCLNTCSINPCKNDGRCVNLFTRAGCDCFGTGFDGDRCTAPSRTLHMEKKDFIKWNFRDSYRNTVTSSLRLRLKAANANGLLFYTKRLGNIFVVELINGHIRIALGMEELREMTLHRNLYDGDWHSIEIMKTDVVISATIDNQVTRNLTIDANNVGLDKDEPVYFGGLEQPKYTFGVKGKQGFVGCIQQLRYNKIDVIYQVQNTISKRIVKVGNINVGCPFNKSNIKLPTTKPVGVKTAATNDKGDTDKTKVIKEIHTRETITDGGIGQGVIVWITAAIVIGTIIIMISAACVVHHVRLRNRDSRRKKSSDSEDGGDMRELTQKTTLDTNVDYSSSDSSPTMVREKNKHSKKSSTPIQEKHDNCNPECQSELLDKGDESGV